MNRIICLLKGHKWFAVHQGFTDITAQLGIKRCVRCRKIA